jgi:hypothetical protein
MRMGGGRWMGMERVIESGGQLNSKERHAEPKAKHLAWGR